MFQYSINLRQRLLNGETLWGAGLPEAANLLAKLTINTGVDFLWIDTEHTSYGVESLEVIPLLARLKGRAPIVRVSTLDSGLIKKALDLGGSGIMVPQINNADEARRTVEYAKCPPEGSRGVSPLWPLFLDTPPAEYLSHANDETCVIVQIESMEGIQNLDEIAQVKGVDVVFAGPANLSAALGHIGQTNHPEVFNFLHNFPSRVAKFEKQSGIAVFGYDAAKRSWDQGYRFIIFGQIYSYGKTALAEDLRILREETKHTIDKLIVRIP